ncbi:MAG: hypothetical protein ISN29_04570 [Gammaproteobacteria bacterium AqS3]|nr:hypothetical protein [Gammaproteobacteria bacterium AqS3]
MSAVTPAVLILAALVLAPVHLPASEIDPQEFGELKADVRNIKETTEDIRRDVEAATLRIEDEVRTLIAEVKAEREDVVRWSELDRWTSILGYLLTTGLGGGLTLLVQWLRSRRSDPPS